MLCPEDKITAHRGLHDVLHLVVLPENCCMAGEERLESYVVIRRDARPGMILGGAHGLPLPWIRT